MKSIISHEANHKRLENQECRLHSLYSCSLCQYDGTYSLDIEDPTHQVVISNFLAKSRKKNYRELMYERINDRRNNRRRFLRRIREQPREQTVTAEDIVVVSSDDETDMMTPTPVQVDTSQVQAMQQPATVPRVSRNNHTVEGNIPNTSLKRLFGTRLGITMPAGAPGTMTASVNYTGAGDSGVTCVSSRAGMAKTGVPLLNSSPRVAKVSQSTSRASVIRCSLMPSSSSPTDTTTPARTDVSHSPSPGAKTRTYSAQWLSLQNSSTTSLASSGTNSIGRRITSYQGAPSDQMGESHTDEELRNTASLTSRFRETSLTIPDVSMNTFQAKNSNGEVCSVVKTVRSSVSNTHSCEALFQRTPPVSGSVSDQHTTRSRSGIDSRSSMLSSCTVEGHTMVSRNAVIPAPTCYSHSGGLAPVKLCSEKCSEGRCYIIKCSSKDCPTYIPNTRKDGNCSETQSLVSFSPAQNSQPLQQKTTLPREINVDKCLKVPLQTKILHPSSGRHFSSSSPIGSNLRNRAPYRFERTISMPPFSSQPNRTLGSLAGHSSNRPLTSSIREMKHSYGTPKPKAIEILVKTQPSPENTSLSGANKRKLSFERANSRSPDEVVESYLTRKLSSTAPRSVVFSPGRLLARGAPSSSGADLSIPVMNKTVNSKATERPFTADRAGSLIQANATSSRESTLNINPTRNRALALFSRCISASAKAAQTKWSESGSSYKQNLEVEEPPMKKLRYISPETTTATVVRSDAFIRTPSSNILTKSNEWNATPRPTVTFADATSNSLHSSVTANVESASDETERLLPTHISTDVLPGPYVPGSSIPSGSMLIQESSLTPEQPLLPFENISGKLSSRDKPTPPENEVQCHRNEQNIYLQKILDWLLNSTSEPLLPILQSTTEENAKTAGPGIPASRTGDIHDEDVQNQNPLVARRRTGIKNRRTLIPPTRIICQPVLKPTQGSQERQGDQGSQGSQESVSKSQISPYNRIKKSDEPSSQRIRCPRSEDFVIRCEGHQGFKVSASILERASPTLKDFAEKCCRWYEIDGLEYRTFDVLGVTHWAMLELLKFALHDSYNHNLMKTSHMKRLLNMLQIKYKQTQTFIFPVEPQSTDLR